MFTLVASWPTPGVNPRGADVYGSICWMVDDGSSPHAYRIDRNTGSVIASFAAPGGPGAWGICYEGGGSNLYISNYASSYIYTVTTAGSVVASFHSSLAGPADLDYNSGFFIAFPNQNIVARLDPATGSVLSSYPGPGTRAAACWGMNYFIADTATHTVYQYGYPAITGIQTPVGLGGELLVARSICLWIADDATDRVYLYGEGLAVESASFGRVKAFYR